MTVVPNALNARATSHEQTSHKATSYEPPRRFLYGWQIESYKGINLMLAALAAPSGRHRCNWILSATEA